MLPKIHPFQCLEFIDVLSMSLRSASDCNLQEYRYAFLCQGHVYYSPYYGKVLGSNFLPKCVPGQAQNSYSACEQLWKDTEQLEER